MIDVADAASCPLSAPTYALTGVRHRRACRPVRSHDGSGVGRYPRSASERGLEYTKDSDRRDPACFGAIEAARTSRLRPQPRPCPVARRRGATCGRAYTPVSATSSLWPSPNRTSPRAVSCTRRRSPFTTASDHSRNCRSSAGRRSRRSHSYSDRSRALALGEEAPQSESEGLAASTAGLGCAARVAEPDVGFGRRGHTPLRVIP